MIRWQDDNASVILPSSYSNRSCVLAKIRSFAAVLYLLLYFVFALYERKNEIQNKMECTMLPQASRR
jgi:hypothetical protein